VTYPHEDHIYAARESRLHVLAESFDWFDKYVKHAKKE
jgi:dipeptidyl aminopeptidase/acylaminoacyl peptidase